MIALALLATLAAPVDHVQAAKEAFGEQRFADAATELGLAYAASPEPWMLFSKGQSEQLAGNCDAAVESFRRFIDTGPQPEDAEEAQRQIEACGGEPKADVPEPPPPSPVQTPAPAPPAPPKPKPDALGHASTWSGAAVTVTGVALLVTSVVRANDAADSTEQRYVDGIGPARAMNRAGFVVTSIGAALLIGGIARLGWKAAHRDDDRLSNRGALRF